MIETLLVTVAVGLAALYLARKVWRTLRAAGASGAATDGACGCGPDEGCPAASELARDLQDALRR